MPGPGIWGIIKVSSHLYPPEWPAFVAIMLHEKAPHNPAQTTPSMHLWVCRSAGIGSRLWVCSTGLILWYRLRVSGYSVHVLLLVEVRSFQRPGGRALSLSLSLSHTHTHTQLMVYSSAHTPLTKTNHMAKPSIHGMGRFCVPIHGGRAEAVEIYPEQILLFTPSV